MKSAWQQDTFVNLRLLIDASELGQDRAIMCLVTFYRSLLVEVPIKLSGIKASIPTEKNLSEVDSEKKHDNIHQTSHLRSRAHLLYDSLSEKGRSTRKIELPSSEYGEVKKHRILDLKVQDQSYNARQKHSPSRFKVARGDLKVVRHNVVVGDHLGILLAQNEELKALYKFAFSKFEKMRLTNILEGLLKQYSLDLFMDAKTDGELQASYLIENERSRSRIACAISDIVDPETEDDLDEWIRQAQYHGMEVELENFLVKRNPFRRLLTSFWAILLPASLSHLTRILISVPSDRIWFSDENDKSISNKFKICIENLTEENWHWWPLRPKMRMLQNGQTRVHWLCVSIYIYSQPLRKAKKLSKHCGSHLWAELSKSDAERYKELLPHKSEGFPQIHLCAPRRRRNNLKTALHDWISQAAGSGAGSISGSRIQTIAAVNSHQTSSQTIQQGGNSGNSQESKPSSTPNLLQTPQPGLTVNLSPTITDGLFVLFGVYGARRTLELAQIDVKKHQDDGAFFQDLRTQHKRLRGFWRYWLSIWQLKYCDFVKVPLLF